VREREQSLREDLSAFLCAHLCLLALHFLLVLDNFPHLLDGHRALHIDPFVENCVSIPQLEHKIDASDVDKGHKPEASGLLRPFVLQDHAVLNLAEVCKVILELRN
jgi:predicted ATPase